MWGFCLKYCDNQNKGCTFVETNKEKDMEATLVHLETGIEYYKDGSLFKPSNDEKLLWALFGTPENIERIEQSFETEIDKFTGYSKKEIEAKVNQNIEKGLYSFLPTTGIVSLIF
jgi:hypothetical protein